MAGKGVRNKGGDVRERLAYAFMVTVLILLIAVTFAVLGKGEYQPPKQDEGNAASSSVLA